MITGGNPKGLGAATARALIPHKPATLIIAYRSPDKTLALIDELAALAPDTQVRGVMLDLANLDSIRAAAAEVNQMVDHLDLLINNAGVMSVQTRDLTNFGVEAHFGINHIGHFIFTNLILGLLRAAAARNPPGDTRIVNLSGGWYQFGPVRFDDYNWDGKPVPEDQEPDRARLAMFGCQTEGAFLPEAAYAQSKTANILFSVYLSQNLAKEGIYSFGVNPGGKNVQGISSTTVTANLSHDKPGILTDIGRHLPKERADQIIASGLLDKTPDQGVSTTLVAALDPQINRKCSCLSPRERFRLTVLMCSDSWWGLSG